MIRLSTLALLCTLAACDTLGPPLPGPDLAEGPILPVVRGNAWTYATPAGDVLELRIGEPADVEGDAYYRLALAENGRASASDEYVRAVGQGAEFLYLAALDGGGTYREATVYRYPTAEGPYEVGTRQYTVTRDRVSVPAGTFEVVTYSGYDGDPTVSASFAPGVGLVRFNDGQVVRELREYSLVDEYSLVE